MIVDDEKMLLEEVSDLIQAASQDFAVVATAVNGKQALTKYEKFRPQVIFTDIRMPHMDGIEFIRNVRESDRDVKIILLSAYKDFSYAKEAIHYGISDYLIKNEISEETIKDILGKLSDQINSEHNANHAQMRNEIMGFFNEGANDERIASSTLHEKYIIDKFTELVAMKRRRQTGAYSKVILKVMDIISENYWRSDFSVGFIAENVYLSIGHLCASFKKETGMTIHDYVTEVRMIEAKKRLDEVNLKIYEVAESVGYKSSQYFSQVFYSRLGMTPSEYQRNKV
jgi:two-component system response regulator YesN